MTDRDETLYGPVVSSGDLLSDDYILVRRKSKGGTPARIAATSLPGNGGVTDLEPGIPVISSLIETTPGVISISWTYLDSVTPDVFFILRNNSDLPVQIAGDARFYVDQGVTPGDYNYQVVAFTAGFGRGTPSAEEPITVTAVTNPDAPSAPTNVQINVLSSTVLQVTWEHFDNSANGFRVKVEGPNAYVRVFNTGTSVRQQYIDTLIPGTIYSVEVAAYTTTYSNGLPVPVITYYAALPVQGTTSSGTPVTALAWTAETTAVITGQVGVALAGISPVLATGGISGATLQYAVSVGKPSWLTLNATSGAWSGTPTAAITNLNMTVTATDGVDTISIVVAVAIQATTLVVTKSPSLANGAIINITGGVAMTTRTWTVSEATAPYTIQFNGTVPSPASAVITGTTLTISGTPTQALSSTTPWGVTVSSADGQSFSETYTCAYAAATGNVPPVITGYGTSPATFTEGVAVTAMNTITATDANSDTLTMKLESVRDKDGNEYTITGPTSDIYTVTGLGITFNRSTGVLGGTYTAGAAAVKPIFYSVSVDDAQTAPLSAYSTIGTLYTSGVSASPVAVGIVATGGSGVYSSYAVVSGTPPSWLGAFNTSTGLFPGTGGATITGGAASPTLVLRVTDSAAATFDVTVPIVVLAEAINDTLTRVPGTLCFFDMEKVYLNGNTTPVRTVTSEGNSANRGSSYSGTFFGEACSVNKGSQLAWINDPTGYQTKVLRMRSEPSSTLSESMGTFGKRLDGTLNNTNSGGTVYSTIFFQFSFFATREIFAWAQDEGTREMKLGYLGTGFTYNQVVVSMWQNTGFPGLYVFPASSIATTLINAIGEKSPSFHQTAAPNPWGATRLQQQMGEWPIAGTPPASNAGKLAWYEYYGAVSESGKGLASDLANSLGRTGVTSGGAQTRWLDQRVHNLVDTSVNPTVTTDLGWPATTCRGKSAYIKLNARNTIQVMYKREADGWGQAAAWLAHENSPFRTIADTGPRGMNWGTNSTALDSHRIGMIMNYSNNREANTVQATADLLFYEWVSSLTPIKSLGGHVPVPLT